MNKDKSSLPPELVSTACLSAGLTILLTLSSIVLCTLALVFRFDCEAGSLADSNGSKYFLVTLLRTYILAEDCTYPLILDDLTKVHVVFILTIIILAFAVIGLFTAIALIVVVSKEEAAKNIDILTYVYVGVCVASLVVDLTLGVHFGIDYQTIKNNLASNSPGLFMNYERDMVRLGAFFLMTLSLKGFIGHTINIVLLILLTYQVIAYQQNLSKNKHSIHKLGALNAFDTPKRLEDPWNPHRNDMSVYQRPRSHMNHQNEDEPQHIPMRENNLNYENSNPPKGLEDPWNPYRNDIYRGSKTNPAFINDDEPPRAPIRDNNISDLNRPANRSDSWLHNQINSGPGLGSRPFSYLEEPKRPVPVKPPMTPTNEPNWRRDPWPQGPPVPDPDYSPQPRRLKSALKSNYP